MVVASDKIIYAVQRASRVRAFTLGRKNPAILSHEEAKWYIQFEGLSKASTGGLHTHQHNTNRAK